MHQIHMEVQNACIAAGLRLQGKRKDMWAQGKGSRPADPGPCRQYGVSIRAGTNADLTREPQGGVQQGSGPRGEQDNVMTNVGTVVHVSISRLGVVYRLDHSRLDHITCQARSRQAQGALKVDEAKILRMTG